METSRVKSGLRWLWSVSSGTALRWPFRSWTTGTTSSRSRTAGIGVSKSRLQPLVGETLGVSESLAARARNFGTARSMSTPSCASTSGRESSCACLWQALVIAHGSTGQTLIVGAISAYCTASRHSAVDVLVSVSAQEMKTVEPKQTAGHVSQRRIGSVGTKSGQRAGSRSCHASRKARMNHYVPVIAETEAE